MTDLWDIDQHAPCGNVFRETLLLTAIPEIVQDFVVPYRISAWVFSAYLIVTAVMMPIAGKLFDIYGSKRVLLVLLALYVARVVAGVIALLMARMVPGMKAATASPLHNRHQGRAGAVCQHNGISGGADLYQKRVCI